MKNREMQKRYGAFDAETPRAVTAPRATGEEEGLPREVQHINEAGVLNPLLGGRRLMNGADRPQHSRLLDFD